MLFQDRQSMQRDLCHTPKISRRFASEWRFGPSCCDPAKKPHWPFSSFDSTISRHFLSWHLAYTFPGKLSSDNWYLSVVYSLLAISFLEYRNNHTCLTISGCFFHATWRTRVNQRILFPISAFNISGLISSSPAAFPDFIPLVAVATSAAVKTSSSPKCITSCVSQVDAFTGFKRFSKYSLYRKMISFSSVRMLPAEYLVEYVTLDLLSRKRRMACQNTLFAEK